MNTNWDRLEEIFAQAIDLAPAERPAFLDQRCASAAELRAELESLLQAHEQAEVSFASRSAAVRDILGAIGSGFLAGKTLGHYRMENHRRRRRHGRGVSRSRHAQPDTRGR